MLRSDAHAIWLQPRARFAKTGTTEDYAWQDGTGISAAQRELTEALASAATEGGTPVALVSAAGWVARAVQSGADSRGRPMFLAEVLDAPGLSELPEQAWVGAAWQLVQPSTYGWLGGDSGWDLPLPSPRAAAPGPLASHIARRRLGLPLCVSSAIALQLLGEGGAAVGVVFALGNERRAAWRVEFTGFLTIGLSPPTDDDEAGVSSLCAHPPSPEEWALLEVLQAAGRDAALRARRTGHPPAEAELHPWWASWRRALSPEPAALLRTLAADGIALRPAVLNALELDATHLSGLAGGLGEAAALAVIGAILPRGSAADRALALHVLSGLGPVPRLDGASVRLVTQLVGRVDVVALVDALLSGVDCGLTADPALIAGIREALVSDGRPAPDRGWPSEWLARHAVFALSLSFVAGWAALSPDRLSRTAHARRLLDQLGLTAADLGDPT